MMTVFWLCVVLILLGYNDDGVLVMRGFNVIIKFYQQIYVVIVTAIPTKQYYF